MLKFESWSEFLAYFKDKPILATEPKSMTVGDYGFRQTNSFDEAMDLAVNGWASKAAEVEAVATPIIDRVSSLVERYDLRSDVEGIGIDIGAYVNGEPECWNRFEESTSPAVGTKHLKIVFNCGLSAGTDKSIVTAKGTAIFALIKSLEFANIRCELWVSKCSTSRQSGNFHGSMVKVKSADQDLDGPRAAFALCHPSMPRRMFLGIDERQDFWLEFGFYGGANYGLPTENEESERGDLYIGRSFLGEPQWTNQASVEAWIEKTLKEQGVILHPIQAER